MYICRLKGRESSSFLILGRWSHVHCAMVSCTLCDGLMYTVRWSHVHCVPRSTSIDNQSTLSAFNEGAEREQRELTAASQLTGWRKAQMQVWMVLDHPRSSRIAMVGTMDHHGPRPPPLITHSHGRYNGPSWSSTTPAHPAQPWYVQ